MLAKDRITTSDDLRNLRDMEKQGKVEAVLEGSEVTLVELEVFRFSNDRQHRDGFRAVSSPYLCSRYGFVTGNQLLQRVVLCGFGCRLADARSHTNDNSTLFEAHFVH
jgi:hypothetical protein